MSDVENMWRQNGNIKSSCSQSVCEETNFELSQKSILCFWSFYIEGQLNDEAVLKIVHADIVQDYVQVTWKSITYMKV